MWSTVFPECHACWFPAQINFGKFDLFMTNLIVLLIYCDWFVIVLFVSMCLCIIIFLAGKILTHLAVHFHKLCWIIWSFRCSFVMFWSAKCAMRLGLLYLQVWCTGYILAGCSLFFLGAFAFICDAWSITSLNYLLGHQS